MTKKTIYKVSFSYIDQNTKRAKVTYLVTKDYRQVFNIVGTYERNFNSFHLESIENIGLVDYIDA